MEDSIDGASHVADLEVVTAALRGEAGAVRTLLERLAVVPALVRSHNKRYGNRLSEADLDEVAQETLLSVWGKLNRFEGRSKLETWVYGFVIRENYKARDRASRLERQAEWDSALSDSQVAQAEVTPDEYAVVHESLGQLGGVAARIIRLKHFEVLTFEEIGRQLAMPTNTVKTRYYRGLERLRTLLQPVWREQLS